MYTLKHPNKIENPLRQSIQPWWNKYCSVCFPVFSCFLLVFTTAIMLLIDDNLDEEGVLMILDKLEVQNWSFTNLVLVKIFPQNFVVDGLPTSSFPPALDADNYACGRRPMRRTRARLRSQSRILKLSTKHPEISRLVQNDHVTLLLNYCMIRLQIL